MSGGISTSIGAKVTNGWTDGNRTCWAEFKVRRTGAVGKVETPRQYDREDAIRVRPVGRHEWAFVAPEGLS